MGVGNEIDHHFVFPMVLSFSFVLGCSSIEFLIINIH
ncbi:hypothetical protein EVA_15988 [gut metagenome]|uniref:Uncharacterized protein n=1 Tax=gut metagenome TaxID=749906 RepID=J9C7R7_9ZZZZ